MRASIEVEAFRECTMTVPGDKSIAHRWLILAATGLGPSRLAGLPPSLDVTATASCLAAVCPPARPALEAWIRTAPRQPQGHRFTCDSRDAPRVESFLEVEGQGRRRLQESPSSLDCANSGTSMRLLAGVLAAAPFPALLIGDESLSSRPMERIAAPLREMGAQVETADGRPPIRIHGGALHGIDLDLAVPSAQVKSAVLLAGTAADGTTSVREPVSSRDHTERALAAMGAPVRRDGARVEVEAFQHGGLEGEVPGDVSSAAFVVAAAALAGGGVTVEGVGLNPTRTRWLDVMRRMGVRVDAVVREERVGEPVGDVRVDEGGILRPIDVAPDELPLVIDEVPILAILAANAGGTSRFAGARELRVKESDRLAGTAEGVRALGGRADDAGDDLEVYGDGLHTGAVDSHGDHRLAMAFSIAAFGVRGPVVVDGIEAAGVSYPGFIDAVRSLGASVPEAR